jgi:hypothetical protein
MTELPFEIPPAIDRHLATLSKLYAKRGASLKQSVIVNAAVSMKEGVSHDNWNGGIDGHDLYLALPEAIYAEIFDQKDAISEAIRKDLNQVIGLDHEFIESVRIRSEPTHDEDWRSKSGFLARKKRVVHPDAQTRIWQPEGRFRVFLSHRSDVKTEIGKLRDDLAAFGVACFVAHSDIKPTREWQAEIENAVFSADALVAAMTPGFHESDWTDQEIGIAFGRGIPIIALRLGQDPYGFIGKFQALTTSWENAAREIVKLLSSEEALLVSYVAAIENCGGWDAANRLAEVLPALKSIPITLVDRLIRAYNQNREIRNAFGFNGKRPNLYGEGLVHHLERATRQRFTKRTDGTISRA